MNPPDTFAVESRGEHEIVISRSFNAPRELVWRAMSDPQLLRRWLIGPPGWEMTVCEGELRAGGEYRWAWKNDEGIEMGMHGEYRDVTPPSRMVRTEIFSGCPAQLETGPMIQVATLELEDQGEHTRMIVTVAYPSSEARDAVLQSGMKEGMEFGYNLLDELFAKEIA